jgi:signal-transduction protein with cAMP-binding, CBS, and nucleotidyltransferase domain
MFYFKDIKKATWIAAKGGKLVGGILAFFGLLGIFSGLWNGLWFIFLGGFLWFIAGLSYEQVIVKEVLTKVNLQKLIKKDYTNFLPTATFDKVIEHYKKTGEENFIISKGQKFLGIVDLRRMGKLDKAEWRKVLVSSVMVPEQRIKALTDKDTAFTALRKMSEQSFKLLPWLRKSKIVGVVYNKSLMHQLTMKLKYGL